MTKEIFNEAQESEELQGTASDYCIALCTDDPSGVPIWVCASVAGWEEEGMIEPCENLGDLIDFPACDIMEGYFVIGDDPNAVMDEVAAHLIAKGFQWREDFQRDTEDSPEAWAIRERFIPSTPGSNPQPEPSV